MLDGAVKNLLRILARLFGVAKKSPGNAPISRRPGTPPRQTGKPSATRPSTTGPSSSRPGGGTTSAGKPGAGSGSPRIGTGDALSPGQFGVSATVEIKASAINGVRMTYAPDKDGSPDPGEVVWTWVPFEENDGRGKDRPVLVVAAEPGGTVLAVQFTSKAHEGDAEFIPVGAGAWDSENRPSWVNIERVLRVHPDGMRREATALPRAAFDKVAARLQARYRWL